MTATRTITQYAVSAREEGEVGTTYFVTEDKQRADRECSRANQYRDGGHPYRVVSRQVIETREFGPWTELALDKSGE